VVRTQQQTEQLVKALYGAVFIVVVVGFAQFLAAEGGWDFPYETFSNNPVYAQGTDQEIYSFRRINSTFTEPSNAGSYLAAIACGLLASFLRGRRGVGWFLALLGVTVTLFLTTSTTGFATLAIGVCVLLVYFNPFRQHKDVGKSSTLGWVAILAVFGTVGSVLLLQPDLLEAALNATVEKGESHSFWFRLANELHSIEIFLQTYGVGVGLGSNRSSGLILTMLSSVGLVGTALFTVVLYKMSKSFPGISARSSLQMGFWALVTMIISEVVAVPDLNRPVLWALLLLVLAQLNVELNPRLSVKPARLNTVPARRRPLQPSPGIAPAS
jgi:hypothetical protein